MGFVDRCFKAYNELDPDAKKKTQRPAPREGRVAVDEQSQWFLQSAFMTMKREGPPSQVWRALVEIAPVIGSMREDGLKVCEQRIALLEQHNCAPFAVHVNGYRIGDTQACETRWWIDVLVPIGFDPRKHGIARPW